MARRPQRPSSAAALSSRPATSREGRLDRFVRALARLDGVPGAADALVQPAWPVAAERAGGRVGVPGRLRLEFPPRPGGGRAALARIQL